MVWPCPPETDAVPHVQPGRQHGRGQTDAPSSRYHLWCPESGTQSRGSFGQTRTAVTSICPLTALSHDFIPIGEVKYVDAAAHIGLAGRGLYLNQRRGVERAKKDK